MNILQFKLIKAIRYFIVEYFYFYIISLHELSKSIFIKGFFDFVSNRFYITSKIYFEVGVFL